MDGGERDGVAETEGIELIERRVDLRRVIHLVHDEHHGLMGAQEHACDLLVRGGDAGADLRHEDDDVCGVDGDVRLLAHEEQDLVVRRRLDAAGVHDVEFSARPLRLGVEPVTGDAGGVLHDGEALSGEAVEQQGFAHVRASHNGYKRSCHGVS